MNRWNIDKDLSEDKCPVRRRVKLRVVERRDKVQLIIQLSSLVAVDWDSMGGRKAVQTQHGQPPDVCLRHHQKSSRSNIGPGQIKTPMIANREVPSASIKIIESDCVLAGDTIPNKPVP